MVNRFIRIEEDEDWVDEEDCDCDCDDCEDE